MLKHPRGVIESPTASGKTELMAAVAQEFLVQRGWRTLVIVPRKGLARQTAARFRKYYGDAIRVGQVGDGEMSKGDVIVATSQSMIGFLPRQKKLPNSQIVRTIPGNPMLAKILDTFEVLMLDETHHASSESWYQIAMHSNACRRYGLSGTPLKNSEFSDMRMTGATGPVIFRVETQELIEKELVNFPRICMVMHPDASHPPLPKQKVVTRGRDGRLRVYYRDKEYAEAYSEGVAKSDQHNRAVVRAACWMADNNRRTLVLCRLREHFCKLSAMLEATGVRFEACWGATDTGTRDEVKRRLREGDARVILATTIFDEGEDLVGVEGLVLAEGVQVNTSALQRIGRGMRRQTGGDGYLWVVDFVPLCHRKLTEHALKRCEAYESRGYDVRLQDEWPADGDDSDLLPFKRWDAVAVA
jgi:superfamily II DNA or RNA helicase